MDTAYINNRTDGDASSDTADYRHGGDIYRNSIDMDFSVSINPLEWPEGLRSRISDIMSEPSVIYTYPDALNERLKVAIAAYTHDMPDRIVCGNGASELITAVCRMYRPDIVLLPSPCYTGYDRAIRASKAKPVYLATDEQSGFSDISRLLTALKRQGGQSGAGDDALVILNNPCNPTGRLTDVDAYAEVIGLCGKKGIPVIIDESFIELALSDEEYDRIYRIDRGLYESGADIIRLRSLTKSHRLAGLRLGFAICEGGDTAERLRGELSEWNISVPATEVGIACLEDKSDYLARSREYIASERERLIGELGEAGLKTYESDVNFILIYSDLPLYEKLMERRILIRDCRRIEGLKSGFYRVSLRSRGDDYALMCSIKDIIAEAGKRRQTGI